MADKIDPVQQAPTRPGILIEPGAVTFMGAEHDLRVSIDDLAKEGAYIPLLILGVFMQLERLNRAAESARDVDPLDPEALAKRVAPVVEILKTAMGGQFAAAGAGEGI